MASTFQYPSVVSRTLDVSGKSLKTIISMHDRQITDADINALQDLQTYKLQKFTMDHGVTSGSLTYAPFQFSPSTSYTFIIPQFDVLFNNEVVTIAGQFSSNLAINRIQIPSAPPLTSGDEDARTYIVYLEIWYRALNPITGAGYYPPGGQAPFYYFPYGGVLPDSSNAVLVPDDSVDPFQGLFTTERAQIQWRLGVQRVALDYDFTQEQYGFYYPGAKTADANYLAGNIGYPGQIIYGQAWQPSLTPGVSPLLGLSPYVFTNLGTVNGDTGLWRCGDGNINNSLGTMDGYSYAMPIAVVFQRNTGNFNVNTNVFGCASPLSSGSGTLATGISGRLDYALADQIFPADVVDTRTTTSLCGWDVDDIMRKGFTDLILGKTNLAVSRFGDVSGNKSEAVGSLLNYYVYIGTAPQTVANTIDTFDGYYNGFSSDQRTFLSTRQINPNTGKSSGLPGQWALNDAFAISLPSSSTSTITSVQVTALINDPTYGIIPVQLLPGQIQINGLNSRTATVTFITDLSVTAFDPGGRNLYATVGVTYPAGSPNLNKIPVSLKGGIVQDAISSKTLPMFGVSEYEVQSEQPTLQAQQIISINPEYSDIVFGTRILIAIPGSNGSVQTVNGASQTSFVINGTGLNGFLNGFYVIQAADSVTGSVYNIQSNLMASLPAHGGVQNIVPLAGAVDPNSTVTMTFLAQDTAELAYNAPVRGVTQIEETVVIGQNISNPNFRLDPRVIIESVSYSSSTDTNTIVMGANLCDIRGIAGDDSVRFIWFPDSSGNLTASPVKGANFGSGTLVISVAGNNGALKMNNTTPFIMIGAIAPAFDVNSSLLLQLQYVPYQGEGVLNRDYDIMHSEDNALITTNGTGAAPVIGLYDIYPYNREFPISVSLPAQPSWSDNTLLNNAIASIFDSNYVAMRANNVEHTFLTPLHTNDFIPPVNKDTRKTIRFVSSSAGGRGFSQAIPHLGFAVEPPVTRSVLGQNLQSTQAPITLYVNNVTGSDTNTGLSTSAAKQSILSALQEFPPVLRHPCTIVIAYTGVSYLLSQLQSSLETIALGDGNTRPLKQYALGNLSRVIQDQGRLIISSDPSTPNPIVIDATGFAGFGDGPTSAFYIETSRVLLNGMQFIGFLNPTITAYDSDINFVNCSWVNNVQAGAYIGCDSVILNGGSTQLTTSGTGHVLSQSNLTVSNHSLVVVASTTPSSAFFVGTRNSTMTLQQHSTSTLDETNIAASSVVATAQLNSSISTDGTFQTAGNAVLSANSVLLQPVTVTPFLGGVVTDPSSSVVSQVG